MLEKNIFLNTQPIVENATKTENGIQKIDLRESNDGENISQEKKEINKLAIAHGTVYKKLLEAIASHDNITDTELNDFLNENLIKIPKPAQELYKKGLEMLIHEIEKNKKLLDMHRGDEVSYLTNDLLASLELSDEKIAELKLLEENSDMDEPLPGVPILNLSYKIGKELRNGGHLPSGYMAVMSPSDKQPSYVVMGKSPITPLDGGYPRKIHEDEIRFDHSLKIHEIHHFVWELLERSGFTRKAEDDDVNRRDYFELFRHEMVANIVSDGPIGMASFNTQYSYSNREFSNEMKKYQEYLTFLYYSKCQGDKKPLKFIYPIMVSRNFNEFTKKTFELIDINEENFQDILGGFYIQMRSSFCRSSELKLIESKALSILSELCPIKFSQQQLLDLCTKLLCNKAQEKLINQNNTAIDEKIVKEEAETIVAFVNGLTEDKIDINTVIQELISLSHFEVDAKN